MQENNRELNPVQPNEIDLRKLFISLYAISIESNKFFAALQEGHQFVV